MAKYEHGETIHNLKSPNIIVPEIIKLLQPKSVVDIGCGLGTFLNAFKNFGITDVLGVDGSWVNKDLLSQHLSDDEFLEFDLEKEIILDKSYDLVVSLEVAEHLSEASANIFVKSLVNAGNLILFSAAIPRQGGQNHINEQWLTYWEEKFEKHDYIIHDIIRPLFWNNSDIFWWYKQNMVLIAPRDFKLKLDMEYVPMRNIVHYELFAIKAREHDEMKSELLSVKRGKESASKYLKWLLYSIFGYDLITKIRLAFTKNH